MARYSEIIQGLEILRKYDADGFDQGCGVRSAFDRIFASSEASMIEVTKEDKTELEQLGWFILDDLWQHWA